VAGALSEAKPREAIHLQVLSSLKQRMVSAQADPATPLRQISAAVYLRMCRICLHCKVMPLCESPTIQSPYCGRGALAYWPSLPTHSARRNRRRMHARWVKFCSA